MTNKTLVVSIVVLLAVFAGVVAAVNYRNNKAEKQEMTDALNKSADQDIEAVTDEDINPPQQAQTPTSTPSATTGCVRNFDGEKLAKDKVDIKNRTVDIEVKNFGTVRLSFYDKDSPKAVENFLRLVNSGYYNCLTFHRVAKGFVIQGGDPLGNGMGGQSAFGAPFADEVNASSTLYQIQGPAGTPVGGYKKGTLAMANSGPNTNGSQFFIMLNDVPTQPGGFEAKYTIFGKVVSGQDVVDKIGGVEISSPYGDGPPVTPVVMESVKIYK